MSEIEKNKTRSDLKGIIKHRMVAKFFGDGSGIEDIQLKLDDFKPDPSLGKYRSEQVMFDETSDNVLHKGQLYDPKVDKRKPFRTI